MADDPLARLGGARPAVDQHPSRAWTVLDQLHDVPLNFEPPAEDEFSADEGWVLDSYAQPLPSEPPGGPLPDGAWEVARRAMADYEFADPRLIRALYYPDRELAGRTMLLTGRFLCLRFHMGARVYSVVDETRDVEGRTARIWGWGYQTLRGHLETGRMRFEVWKWLDDGTVEFRIDAASRAAHIPNVITRLGFRMFGRRLQLRFAERALARMDAIVRARLAGREVREPTVLGLDIRPRDEAPARTRD